MHYYQFNIADYRKDASHLTPVEHYIYRWLIDEYHLKEKPINNDIPALIRMMRLKKKDRKSVEIVLTEFFTPAHEEDYKIPNISDCPHYVQIGETPELAQFWVHQRIENEIKSFHELKEKKSAAGKASAAARQQKMNSRSTPVQQTINHKPITNISVDGKPSTRKNGTRCSPVPFTEIIEKWNEIADQNGLPHVVKQTSTLKGQIRQRWNDDMPGLSQWENFFDYVMDSKFLSGKTQPGSGRTKPFRATLAWITKESNFAKIAAGEYH